MFLNCGMCACPVTHVVELEIYHSPYIFAFPMHAFPIDLGNYMLLHRIYSNSLTSHHCLFGCALASLIMPVVLSNVAIFIHNVLEEKISNMVVLIFHFFKVSFYEIFVGTEVQFSVNSEVQSFSFQFLKKVTKETILLFIFVLCPLRYILVVCHATCRRAQELSFAFVQMGRLWTDKYCVCSVLIWLFKTDLVSAARTRYGLNLSWYSGQRIKLVSFETCWPRDKIFWLRRSL